MHTDLSIYRCYCAKCSHAWNTKSHDLPTTCPKCHRVTWDDDHIETPQVVPQPANERIGTIDVRSLPKNVEPERPVEEWRFTKDKPDFAEDGRTYRSQYLVENPRTRRMVRVDDDNHDAIV